jgi:hypothetical protein
MYEGGGIVTNRIATMLLILLVLPVLASAEIYKYRDQNGVLRFTDNLAEVPIAQRENIQQYQEVKTRAETVEQTPADGSEKEAVQDAQTAEKALTDEKGVLDQEYSQLMALRSSIEAAPQPGTPEETAAHKKKIQDYNIQLNIYEVKVKAFREKLEAYHKGDKE